MNAALSEELRRPEAYGPGVAEVGFLQTHVSWLFFAGERVYKVKKPVDLGFLDFTTLDRRRFFCSEEVRLNRRLAPDAYLGVVPIRRGPDGRLRVDGGSEPVAGEVVEWAVEMVRLPEAGMLANLLASGVIDNQMTNDLVALLSAFHREAATGEGIDDHGGPETVRRNLEENFRQTRAFVDDPGALTAAQHAFLEARGGGFLDANEGLLERRVQEGRIREGHGDLHAGNICFTDAGIVAYDCIEFEPRFRCGDVANDLAFLAMDLDQRGYPAFATWIVKRYATVTDDAELRGLVGFYKTYRAVVRGKVTALAALDPGIDADARAGLRRESMRYFQLACSYELPPALVLMCGLPASGKSWLAERLARTLRAVHVASDVRRKVLAGMAARARAREGWGEGLYAPELKDATYRSLLEGAIDDLTDGHSVLVDATFAARAHRRAFVDAAARLGLPYYVVHVTASEERTRERLAQRAAEGRSASDADLAVWLRAREAFEAPDEVPEGHLVAVASGEGVPEDESALLVDRRIAREAPSPGREQSPSMH